MRQSLIEIVDNLHLMLHRLKMKTFLRDPTYLVKLLFFVESFECLACSLKNNKKEMIFSRNLI